MSCVPCDPCNSVSKGDLDRWTSSLKHVLANQIAMKMFEEYLRSCQLDSIDILELWKMCDGLLRHVDRHNIVKYARDYLHLFYRNPFSHRGFFYTDFIFNGAIHRFEAIYK